MWRGATSNLAGAVCDGAGRYVLTPRIESYLNRGHTVVGEVPSEIVGARCFVRIQPVDKPGVPREEFRYLNSKYSIWEYWNFVFHRLVLRDGWQEDEWDWDLYLLEDEHAPATSESEFLAILTRWVPDPSCLLHQADSDCPV
jgi:hypothetical protein